MTNALKNKIRKNILRLNTSSRGGGIEIDLTAFGFKGEKMAAYQNYLGGGILGSIQTQRSHYGDSVNAKLDKIANNLAQYFHVLTNHDGDEWECATFEETQMRPASAY
jgi:hypothetical protein